LTLLGDLKVVFNATVTKVSQPIFIAAKPKINQRHEAAK
jgi:hypothetical protein